MTAADRNSVIDRLAAIRNEKKALDAEQDQLQAWLQSEAEGMLTDTKLKSIHHTTPDGNSAAITVTDTVSVVVSELLEPIFGKAYPSMVKEETKYTLKAPAKKLLAAIWHKEYCEGSVEEIISSLPCDDKAKKALLKKCKGVNWDKDREHLMNFAGLSEQDASDTAYLIAEAAAYESIAAIIKVNHDGEINAANPDYDRTKNEILELAQLKYSRCAYSDTPQKNAVLRDILGCQEQLNTLDTGLLKSCAARIFVSHFCTVEVELINGVTIKNTTERSNFT